ncbi:MAG: DNA replication and repair protein RecF [Flavobacteriales bacterium]
MSLHLQRLRVMHFRNHREMDLELGGEVNCFIGNNGVGKTNLLDAIHYLSLCKSYFEPIDQHNILLGEEMFMLQGAMVTPDGVDQIAVSVRKGQRKVVVRDRKEYDRLADHVGRYPVVMITPYDAQLVLDGSEVRRKFLDGLIAQFDKGYLDALIRYNRALVQRNALLKRFAAERRGAPDDLAPWDEQLSVHGQEVHRVRSVFMAELSPLLEQHYRGISAGREQVALNYRSALNNASMEELLRASWANDRAAQHTTVGIHRDDLLFTLEGDPLKRRGSQGQQKTYLIALKLAQYDLTHARASRRPILLLDDIFDKIDPQRMRHLLGLLRQQRFGQVFITDTDAGRLLHALEGTGLDVRSFHLPPDPVPQREEEDQRTYAG